MYPEEIELYNMLIVNRKIAVNGLARLAKIKRKLPFSWELSLFEG
jgi:hypothetical protein